MEEAYNPGTQASLSEMLLMQKQRQKYSRQKGMKANGGHHDYEEKMERMALVPSLGTLF